MSETVGRWTALPLVALIRAYQLLVSPLLPPSCRFYPSCSAYALDAVRRFGPLRGAWLTVRRLFRCHPWNPGGVDHVPRRGADGRPVREVWHPSTDPAPDEAAPMGTAREGPCTDGAPFRRVWAGKGAGEGGDR